MFFVGRLSTLPPSGMDESCYERRDRVLLRPWLENMLETGTIPGLEWFDKDQLMFKVPWKHRSKKDWSLRHSSVFLASIVIAIYHFKSVSSFVSLS